MNFKATIKTKTIGVLLLSLLVFSTASLISGNIVSAYVGSADFCPNYFWEGLDTEEELEVSEATCTYITSMLANRYATGCYYSYNDDCTVYRYCSILSTLNNSGIIDEIVVFSKGHRGLPYNVSHGNTNHISLLDHDGDDLIDIEHIYDRTSSKNTFTFLWHCETAEKYETGDPPEDEFGYYGMPYCWTHNEDLVCYGGSGDVVFLGWVDESPQFLTEAEDPYNYAHVAYYFWYYMCDGDTVEEALNNIAYYIFGDANYLASDLCDWLVVWGDKTMELPED
jgi:hypothetical protein